MLLERLHMPTIIKPLLQRVLFNSSRRYLHHFVHEAAATLAPNALVLDAGAGDAPYRHLFVDSRYQSTDFLRVDKQYSDVSYVCDLQNIPAQGSRYDLVLLSQVLEHLPEPKLALQEIHRVLKPSGKLWLSAPLYFPEHEAPYDFYRYTQFGFRHLLTESGFAVERIEWLEGYYGTLSYQLLLAAKSLPVHPRFYGHGPAAVAAAGAVNAFRPLLLLFAALFAHLDMRYKLTTAGHCKNYIVVASKLKHL
jgi:SAM-dependent methyltransferase